MYISNHRPPSQTLTFEAVKYLSTLSAATSTAFSVKYKFHTANLNNNELFPASFDVWKYNAFNSASVTSELTLEGFQVLKNELKIEAR